MNNNQSAHKATKWACGIGISLVLIAVLLVGIGEYFIQFALARDTRNYNIEEQYDLLKERHPWLSTWADSLRDNQALRDTFVVHPDGKRLHAWYVPSAQPTTKTAVLVHGYKDNPFKMMMLGYMYHHCFGWNIFLPDQVAHAQSEGDYIQMGWLDRLAIAHWLEVAHTRFAADTMLLHGVSMGAATTMCLAGDTTPYYVRAFVEDCGYTSVWDEFSGELKNQFGLPTFPLLNAVSLLCKAQLGWDFFEASPLNQVKKCTKPMLFIHGENDTYVPTEMVYPLYQSATCFKQLWIAENSEHAASYRDHHDEYTSVVKAFLQACQLLENDSK